VHVLITEVNMEMPVHLRHLAESAGGLKGSKLRKASDEYPQKADQASCETSSRLQKHKAANDYEAHTPDAKDPQSDPASK
jgi:hypothetical protein